MRKMKNTSTGLELNIVEHIILTNFWEYYVTDRKDPTNPHIAECFVMGFENELGDVYLPEIAPHVVTRARVLREVAPAVGFHWSDTQGAGS